MESFSKLHLTRTQWSILYVSLFCILSIYIVIITKFDISQWDEFRVAANSLEMLHSKNYLVPTFENKPEYWNTKPVLFNIFQIASMKLFGENIFALRLPSIIASLLTLIVFFIFLIKEKFSFIFSFFTILILWSSRGFSGQHVAVSGDFDALLVLFSTLFLIYFYKYIDNLDRYNLILASFFLMAGLFVKGPQILILLPGLLIYTFIFKKQFNATLFSLRFYLIFSIPFILLGLYYFLRNNAQPEYWNAIIENDFIGRFEKDLEYKPNRPFFYLSNLFGYQLIGSSIFLILIPFIWKYISSQYRSLAAYCLAITVPYLIIISFSKTKNAWYDASLYPFYCLLIMISISTLSLIVRDKFFKDKKAGFIMYIISVLVLCIGSFNLGNHYYKLITKKQTTWPYPSFENKQFKPNSF